ncbi:nephrocystin-3-like [Haliotis cracherodii]|uniref:nephrocystin-3-like n=1 Tax=Haliotis cracherodii TaxID=6455 RepID=UPI0039E9AE1C
MAITANSPNRRSDVDGVGELFQEYLSRLERDYNVQDYKGNLVQQVMMALMVSHEGLSENELMEILHIPNHVWSPLYFAMETYILDRSGVLGFAFEELRDAVSSRYMMSQKDRITATKPVIDYFNAKRKNFHNFTDMMAEDTRRTTNELPWLHKDIEDWEGLAMALSDLYIFSRLYREREYDLLELWKDTKLSFNTVASMYMDSMDRYIADRYLLIQEHLEEEAPPGLLVSVADVDNKLYQYSVYVTLQLLEVLTGISNFLNLASCVKGRENVIRRRLNILENVKGKKGMSPAKNVSETLDTQLSLANHLVDIGHYEEGIRLHTSVRDYCQRRFVKALGIRLHTSTVDVVLLQKGHGSSGNMGTSVVLLENVLLMLMLDEEGQQETFEVLQATSLSGIGMTYLLQGMTEKAFEAYNESLELYRKWNLESSVLTCMQNLGYLTMNQEKYQEAIKIFEECMKGLEKIHFGSTYHELGNLMTNIALCYRRLKRLDEAEKMYSR